MESLKKLAFDERAQTSLEYILLVAGVVLFATIAAIILRSQIIAPLTNSAGGNATVIKNVIKNVS